MRKKKTLFVIMTCLIMSLFALPVMAANGPFETDASIAVSVVGGGTVSIEPLDGAPEPDNGTELTLKDGETKTFDFHFTQPCDLQYKVTEIAGSEENVIYDDSEYTAYLFIEASDEGLRPFYAFESGGEKMDSITFKNTVKKQPKAAPVNPGAQKVKTGDVATPLLYIGCAIALIAIIACAAAKKREKQESEY